MLLFSIVLIALGAVGLGYRMVTFKHKEKLVDVGPLKLTADKKQVFVIPPWLSGSVLAVGVLLLVLTMSD